MKKKILSVFLATAMVLSLTACGGNSNADTNADANADVSTGTEADASAETEEEAESEASAITLDGTWPEETVKIGFVGYDSTNEQQIGIQGYLDYLSECYNIEILYSEDLENAEGELSFISDCAAAGCKGIIGYYNVSLEQAAIAASDYGMYYWGAFGGDMEAYEAVKDNEYYLGGYTLGEAEYEAGRSLALTMAEQGRTKVVYCSGGASMGIPMFVDRKEGFYAGIEEANANGANIEVVYEIEGWPGTDAFVAAQTNVMGMDVDAIVSSLGVQMWFQLLLESDKGDSIALATIGEVNDTYYDFFNNGQVTCIVYDSWEVVFGNAIPMILNAVTGNRLVNEDGSAILFPVERWTVTDVEAFNAIYDIHDAGDYIITAEDMVQLIVALNPEATAEGFMNYYGSYNIDTVLQK